MPDIEQVDILSITFPDGVFRFSPFLRSVARLLEKEGYINSHGAGEYSYVSVYPRRVTLEYFLSLSVSASGSYTMLLPLLTIAIELESPSISELLNKLSGIGEWDELCRLKEIFVYIVEKCSVITTTEIVESIPYNNSPDKAIHWKNKQYVDEYQKAHRALKKEWNNMAMSLMPAKIELNLDMAGVIEIYKKGKIREDAYIKFVKMMFLYDHLSFIEMAMLGFPDFGVDISRMVKYAVYASLIPEKTYRNGENYDNHMLTWKAMRNISQFSLFGVLPLSCDNISNLITPDSTVRSYLAKEQALHRFRLVTFGIFIGVQFDRAVITGSIISACFLGNKSLEERWAIGGDPDLSFLNYIKHLYTRMDDIKEYIEVLEACIAMLEKDIESDAFVSIVSKLSRIVAFTTDVDILIPNCSTDSEFNRLSKNIGEQLGYNMTEYRAEEGAQHRYKISKLPINIEIFRSPHSVAKTLQRFHSGQVRHCFNGKTLYGLTSALVTSVTGINYIDRSCKSKNPDKTNVKLMMLHASRGFASPTNIRKTLLTRAILAADPDYREIKEALTSYGTLRCHPETIIFHKYMSKYGILMRRIKELYAEIVSTGIEGFPTLPPIDDEYIRVPIVDQMYNTPRRLEKSDMFEDDHLIYPC